MKNNKNIAIIFAGGSGIRMGSGIPKQFLEVNGKPILVHTLQLFQYHDEIDEIYVSVSDTYITYVEELVKEFRLKKVIRVVAGGETAQDSIYQALKAVEECNIGETIVLIHDGVRPFVSYEVISENIEGVREKGNAVTCTSCNETVLLSENGELVESVPYRKDSYVAQAPQSFFLKDILAAHDVVRQSSTKYDNMVDACTIIRSQNMIVYMVEGNRGNIKVTTPEDVYLFRALLQYKENEQAFGFGLTDKIAMKMKKQNRRSKYE